MKHADESVALQAVEFWSTVCDEEIELALEAEEAAEYSEAPERESSHFARVALPEILPVLLLLLTKQDEDATDDEWNVSMAAGTCLALLAQCVGDGIVSPIIPFVEGNIKSADWRYREAAVMAFGSILDGPEEKILAPLVAQALPILIEMMADSSTQVRDTTAWTLGRVTDVLVKTIKLDAHLPPLVTALVSGLEQSPRIVSNCCWSIMNLAEQLGDAAAETCPVSAYYDGLVSALLRLAERCDSPLARLPRLSINLSDLFSFSSQRDKRVQLAHLGVRGSLDSRYACSVGLPPDGLQARHRHPRSVGSFAGHAGMAAAPFATSAAYLLFSPLVGSTRRFRRS